LNSSFPVKLTTIARRFSSPHDRETQQLAPLLVWVSFCSFSPVVTAGYAKTKPKDISLSAMV